MQANKLLVILVLGFLSVSSGLYSQNSSVKVIDEQTSEACSYANLVLYDMQGNYIKGMSSDINGEVKFSIDKQSKFKISFVGYTTYSGSISPGEKLTISLKPDFLELETVVVTGQYNPKPVDKSIYQIDLISGRQMEERGVNNLAEALSNETNIRLKVDPSLGTSLSLNGLGGENVKFLIDGVPIVGRLNGNVDLTQINMDNVDHIEVVKGPMSVVYGTNALAGVVNIIMKENTTYSNSLKLSSYTGTEGGYNFTASASAIRGNNSLSIQGTRNMFLGIDLSDTTRSMEFKPKLQYNTGLNYAFRKNDFKLKLSAKYFDEEIRHYREPQGVSVIDQYFYTKRFVGSMQVNTRLGENFFFEAIGAYSPYNRETVNYLKDLTTFEQTLTGSSITNFNNIMFRTSIMFEKEGSRISTQAGLDMNRDDASGDKISADDPTMGDYAAFISAQYEFLPNATIQPGLRLIYNTKYQAPITPSINLQWRLFDKINFRASYAKGFRAPSIKELYLDFVDSNHDLHGNPDLKAETNHSFNSSIAYNIEGENFLIKLEPAFFFTSGKNIIEIYPVSAGSTEYQTTNIAKRQTIGGEFNTSFLLYPSLTINAGYGLTGIIGGMMDFGSEGFDKNNFYSNISLSTKYNFRKQKLILAAYFKYYGSTPRLMSVDTDNDPETPDEFVYIYRKAYGDLETTITKQFWGNRLGIILGGKNLLNVTYVGYENGTEVFAPTAFGRYFFLKLNLNLSK